MLSLLVPAALVALSVPAVRGDSQWVQPPNAGPNLNFRNNPTYEVGESMDVQWDSDIEFMDVILWQDYPGAGDGMNFFIKLRNNSRSTSFIWDVTLDGFSQELEEGEDAVFSFALYESGIDVIVRSSHYFNVSLPEVEETQTTTASRADFTSTTTSQEPTTATTEAAEQTTTSADEEEEGGSDGLSTGAVAGVSVGATLGGIALIGGLGFFLWRRRRANKALSTSGASSYGGGYGGPTSEVGVGTPLAPHEYYKPDGQISPSVAGGQYQPPPSTGQYPATLAGGQYPPTQATYPVSQPSHPSQPSNERSELGDNPYNASPPGHPRAQSIAGMHEAP